MISMLLSRQKHRRRADFKKHMQSAISAGVEKPDDAELQQAVSLALTVGEKAQTDELKGRISEVLSHKQQEADRQFAADGSAISADLDQMLSARLIASNPPGYLEQLQVQGKRVEGLRQRPGVSAGLRQAQLSSLDAVLARHRQDFDRYQAQVNALQTVRKFGSTAEAHAAALKQFIAICPDDPRCADFKAQSNNCRQSKP